MEVLTTEEVDGREFEVLKGHMTAGEVCIKDYLELTATSGGFTVTDIDRKVKYVTFMHKVEDVVQAKARLDMVSDVMVIRRQETKRSSYKRHLADELESFRRYAEKSTERVTDTVFKLADEALTTSWIYSNLEDIAEAHVYYRKVYGTFLAATSRGDEPLTDLEAVCAIHAQLRAGLLRNEWRASSTSGWSNLYEAKEREVASKVAGDSWGSSSIGRIISFARSADMLTEKCEELLHER
jgi:hypothetical protein